MSGFHRKGQTGTALFSRYWEISVHYRLGGHLLSKIVLYIANINVKYTMKNLVLEKKKIRIE